MTLDRFSHWRVQDFGPQGGGACAAAGTAILVFSMLTACATTDAARDARPSLPDSSDAAVERDARAEKDASVDSTQLPTNKLQAVVDELAKTPFGTGASLSVVRGEMPMSISVGKTHDAGTDVTETTPFNVASVSKVLTAARVVSLAQEGKLSLQDSVAAHLPQTKLVDDTGANQAATITVEQLLKHQGGLPHQPGDLDATLKQLGTSWQDPALLSKLTAAWTVKLVTQPGNYSYSNIGYVLLGAIVEKTESCNFTDCMDSYLASLKMSHSTYNATRLSANAAHGRTASGFNPPLWYNSRYAAPFNGLWTTPNDLVTFGKVLMAASKDAGAALHAMTLPLPLGQGYGLGIVHRDRSGNMSLEHDGSGPGFLAVLAVLPARGIVVAISCNGGGEVKPQVERFVSIVSETIGLL